MLREKWVSVTQHICNVHSWTGATRFMSCDHGELTDDYNWLDEGSVQHVVSSKVATDRTLLDDMVKLTHLTHTGDNEVFHSTILR